jgi:uncharacterized protein (TIGR04255 family)
VRVAETLWSPGRETSLLARRGCGRLADIMNRYPTRFARSPLAEAVFEMRFSAAPGRGVELLPAVMLAALGNDFPRFEQMPLGTLPREMRDATPQLHHAPVFKLQGDSEAVLLGDRVVSYNATRPYPGWSKFRGRAMQVASALKNSGHLATLDRYSLKYVNVIDTSNVADPTTPFNLRVEAKSCELSPGGFRLRFETKVKDFANIVEFTSGVTSTVGKEKLHGTMVALDTIMEPADAGFWNEPAQRLDAAHDALETIFFELLTSDTINGMGPSYD